jgi:hypothetical protein
MQFLIYLFLLIFFIKVYWNFFIKNIFINLIFLEFFFISFSSLNKNKKLVLKISLSAKKERKGSESCIHKACVLTLFFPKRSKKNERTIWLTLKKNKIFKKGIICMNNVYNFLTLFVLF